MHTNNHRTAVQEPATETRSPAQARLDEQAAEGNWGEFETEILVDEKGAAQLLDHLHHLEQVEGSMNQAAVSETLSKHPFRWKDKVYRIARLQYLDGHALVEVAPHDDQLVAELKRRVEQDRFHHPGFYLGFGFVCFPEDYQKYQS